jgi:protein TonB
VTTFNSAFPYCLTASLVLHAFLLLLWPKATDIRHSPESIAVSVLESRDPNPIQERHETKPVEPTRPRREAPTRPSKAPAIVAQKSSPVLEEKPISPKEVPRAQKETRTEQGPPREEPQQQVAGTVRQLPSLKELLPPITWSASNQRGNGSSGPVNLNTTDPQYVTYFGSIKRSIELVWQYPELALKYGLQGKLLLQFAILNNGELENAVVVRSSGSHVLDEEALRAVKAAAPFKPIPPWIGKNRVEIVASFEYLDNRLNYRFVQ